jgi:hypothetical protein
MSPKANKRDKINPNIFLITQKYPHKLKKKIKTKKKKKKKEVDHPTLLPLG